MKRQKEMFESFEMYHKRFMDNLNASLEALDHDIGEAKAIDSICTDEWCREIERDVDDLANSIYSISEPRWSCSGHSKKIRSLRTRLHDIYSRYRGLNSAIAH